MILPGQLAHTQNFHASVIMSARLIASEISCAAFRETRRRRQLPTIVSPVAKSENLDTMKSINLLLLLALSLGSVFAARSIGFSSANSSTRSTAELYAKNCASCHGRDGQAKTLKGKITHARNLADGDWQGRVSDERIFNSIMNGKGHMPAYKKKFSEQEIDTLVTYVRSLKK
jgi:mono/diheme cytochrome c family protein